MKISYYEKHFIVESENDPETIQLASIYKLMSTEKPTYKYEIRTKEKAYGDDRLELIVGFIK